MTQRGPFQQDRYLDMESKDPRTCEYTDDELGPRLGVHMAVAATPGGRLGFAWYDEQNGEASLRCMEGDEDSQDQVHQLAHFARTQILPATIYVSSKAPTSLVTSLRTLGGANYVRVERAALFTPATALATLESIHLPGMPSDLAPHERLRIMNTTISLSATQQVCAAGALVAVLSREGSLDKSWAPGTPAGYFPLSCIKEEALHGHLLIDPASLRALQIFSEEAHPSAMGIGSSKEGLSVFGILNRCVSPPGRRLLRLWFARPMVDVTALEQRFRCIDALIKAPELAMALRGALKKIKDPPRLVSRVRAQQTLPDATEFIALQHSVMALLRVRDALAALASDTLNTTPAVHSVTEETSGGQEECMAAAAFGQLATRIPDALATVHRLIQGVVDPEQGPDGMSVRYGISRDLDKLKTMYYGMPDLLRKVEVHEASRLAPMLREHCGATSGSWSVVYIPQTGFLLQVEGPLLGPDVLEVMPDLELAADTADGACYHTATTRDLTMRYGDILSKIHDLESSILNEVASRVQMHAGDICHATGATAEADCLLSLASAAMELRLVRPSLAQEPILDIQKGRHLLSEAVLGSTDTQYIPNDTVMNTASKRIHIITGPNCSGKSCYAKQVAIIAYMAHVGSFVPAERATIGIVDRIFTRVATQESGPIPQSTFLVDLSQMAAMLRLSTRASLLVVDEFGKGTLTADGIGLLAGALTTLVTRSEGTPRALITTHFTELSDPDVLSRSSQLEFFSMAVTVPPGERSGDDEPTRADKATEAHPQNVVFLYRLTPGCAPASFGVHCAQLAGLESTVLDRASVVIEARRRGEPIPQMDLTRQLAFNDNFSQTVQSLMALDCSDRGAVQEFLAAVATAVQSIS